MDFAGRRGGWLWEPSSSWLESACGWEARGAARAAADRSALRQVAAFELPGPAGKRFDYLTIDEDDNYLLSAHLGAGLLHVIDLRTNAVVKTVRYVPGVEAWRT